MRRPIAIARVDAPPPEVFERQYRRRHVPVVVRGLLDTWPAFACWSLDGLSDRVGDATVPVLSVQGGSVRMDPRRGLVTRPMPLRELLEEMRRGEARSYMMALPEELPAAVRDELGHLLYPEGALWSRTKVWFSTAGTRSALHFDLGENLHAQLVGRKRFTLFAPSDRRNLYGQPLLSGVPNLSGVDLDNLDLERFPRAARAQPWVCELAPGETLFMPRGWWHHVTTVESSMTVNTWWARGPWLAVIVASGTFKRLYGISR
ncbi:MAG: cupin-like domain-containing protein [Myxococcales bacterium]|nr:cupin-like domain-containing protein [Myxococcales bacterium]MCB9521383.1 cupin-like domain-containing protein [Myxococcales bacterium]MCB9533794.1 cupin-like domain-containing protein [Myxococcales bacterium]